MTYRPEVVLDTVKYINTVHMGQVTEVQLSSCLVLLSVDIKAR